MLLRALNMPLGYLSWFAMVQREIHGRLRYAKLIMVFTLKNNHPFFKSHAWKCNVQANKGLTKVNGKWSTIEFDVFAFSLIFFVSVSHKGVINKCCMFYFYTHQTGGACAGVCAWDCTHQMEKTGIWQKYKRNIAENNFLKDHRQWW